MEGNNYKVYMHTSPSGKRYVGITCQKINQRWSNGAGYKGSVLFYSAIKKYGWNNISHEILHDGLSEDEAKTKEVELIALYQSNDRRYGYNLTAGGDGSVGCIPSEETKRKMSVAHKGIFSGEKHPLFGKAGKDSTFYGKRHSAESKQKMREASIGNKNCLGRKLSEETRHKISESAKSRIGEKNSFYGKTHSKETCHKLSELSKVQCKGESNPNSKMVVQLDLQGNFIRQWDYAAKAHEELGINRSCISMCCTGKRKTAGGYKWKLSSA